VTEIIIGEITTGMYLLAMLTRNWHIKLTLSPNADEQERVMKVHLILIVDEAQMTYFSIK